MLKKERTINLALQNDLEEIKTRQRITEAKLDESKKLISKLEINLDEARMQISQLNTDLEDEKVSKQVLLVQVDQLRTDLNQQQALRADLEKKLNQAQEDSKKMDARLWQLQAQRTDLEVKIKNLEAKSQLVPQTQGVELGKIIVGSEAATGAAAKKAEKKEAKKRAKKERAEKKKAEPKKQAKPVIDELTGKVLVVNKDYDFLVINLGSKEGIAVGDIFSVSHNNKYIGDVKIEKLHESMAAAGFVSPEIKANVSEGDKVIKKTE